MTYHLAAKFGFIINAVCCNSTARWCSNRWKQHISTSQMKILKIDCNPVVLSTVTLRSIAKMIFFYASQLLILLVINQATASIGNFCTTKNCSNCQKALSRDLLRSKSQKRICRMLITRPGCCVHALERQNGIDF